MYSAQMSQSPPNKLANVPSLIKFPEELLEEIFSTIDDHDTLFAFALASRACAALVIPRHIQYRVIRVRHSLPNMWAHLARRTDLTRNIREVHLCERQNYMAPDRYPTSLVELYPDEAGENFRIKNICRALGHMSNLRVFTWSWEGAPGLVRPTMYPEQENSILATLNSIPSLKNLVLRGAFGVHAQKPNLDPDGLLYPGWKLSNLTALCLRGNVWVHPSHSLHVCKMLARMPQLEYLAIPLEFSRLSDCTFPLLKKLKLFLQSGASVSANEAHSCFLLQHPFLEELSWFPIGYSELPTLSLPSLRRLCTTFEVMQALDRGRNNFQNIQSLHIQFADAYFISSLPSLRQTNLEKLRIDRIEDIPSVRLLADVFPSITWLKMPQHFRRVDSLQPHPLNIQDLLDLLPRFSKLEVFRGLSLWSAVNFEKERMHSVIMTLVQTCPHLRELDHCDWHEHRKQFRRIVIQREGKDGENVQYAVKRPLPRQYFDVMDGIFD